MTQKTAVQCLIDELRSGKNLQLEMTKCGHIITEHDNVLNKILQMEKEQHEQTWNAAHQAGRFEGKGIAEENWQTFKQYYNETFCNK